MVMPNNNPKDHYEKKSEKYLNSTMKIRKRCERIIEIDAEDFLKKKKIKKYGRIKRIWKTIQKNYA